MSFIVFGFCILIAIDLYIYQINVSNIILAGEFDYRILPLNKWIFLLFLMSKVLAGAG